MNPSAASERTAYHDVYMAMEVLIERFGGKEKAVAALGKCVEDAKRLANSKRHIKKKGQPSPLREIRWHWQPRPSEPTNDISRAGVRRRPIMHCANTV